MSILTSPVIDFIKVSTEFCRFLEQEQLPERAEFCRVMRGLLPMIYLKATLIDLPERESDGYNPTAVTEQDYDFIRGRVSRVMGENDDFLDTFVEDFKFSETPVLCTISENLADIYQQLRDMAEICRDGDEESIAVALHDVHDDFPEWGQKLLNALRALHDVNYGI